MFVSSSMGKGLVFCGVMAACAIQAASPLGGLAVGVSPDGKNLAAAGDNRTLYLLDASSLEVQKRVWVESSIVAMAFNQAGNKVALEDTGGAVRLVDVADGKVVANVASAEKMAASTAANLLAGVANRNTEIVLHSLDDLTLKGKIAINKGERVAGLGFDEAGKKLAVWFEPVNDASEPKDNKSPTGLKGLEASEYKLKNDGKTSWMRVFDATNGSLAWESKIWYSQSASSCQVLFQGESVLIVNYNNINAIVDPTGAVKLFNTDNSFNYGMGGSATLLLTGGLSNGSYTKVATLEATTFKLDKLPGWPEYFKSFAADSNGVGYGGTSSYRVVRIAGEGKDIKAVPVF